MKNNVRYFGGGMPLIIRERRQGCKLVSGQTLYERGSEAV